MWILYTHLAFSLICFITCFASRLLVSPEKKEFTKLTCKKVPFATVKMFILCLIPVFNFITAATALYMAICPLDKYIELKNKSDASQNRDKEILEQYKKDQAA